MWCTAWWSFFCNMGRGRDSPSTDVVEQSISSSARAMETADCPKLHDLRPKSYQPWSKSWISVRQSEFFLIIPNSMVQKGQPTTKRRLLQAQPRCGWCLGAQSCGWTPGYKPTMTAFFFRTHKHDDDLGIVYGIGFTWVYHISGKRKHTARTHTQLTS
jgi:hypothetical protein